jgi:hypothetical protein
MKILVATPTFGTGPHPLTVEAIGALESAHTWEWRQYRHNPYPVPDGRNVLAQYLAIRDDFLAGDWDALLTIEHDMVPPPHAIDALVETGAPVAYGVYLLRHGSHVLNTWEYVGTRNLGESLTLARYGRVTGVRRVSGVGNGCTLIHRAVIERFPFHDGGYAGQSPDMPLSIDCVRADVLQVAHFDVLCGHVSEGRVLWPYADEWTAPVRIVATQTLNASVNGHTKRLEAGQEYEVPQNDAIHLLRGGYARACDVPASVDPDLRQAGDDAGAQPPEPAGADGRGLVPDADPRPQAKGRSVGKRQPGHGGGARGMGLDSGR